MSDEKRGPSVPENDPDRTELRRDDPFGDLARDGNETLAASDTFGEDADPTMAFDEDATLAAPDHRPPGGLPADLPPTIGKYQILGKLS